MSMARYAIADDLAIEHAECRKSGGGPVSFKKRGVAAPLFWVRRRRRPLLLPVGGVADPPTEAINSWHILEDKS